MIMRYQYTLIKMSKSKSLTTPNAGGDMEQHELPFTAGENAK